jgi:hypothetical protein
MKKIILLSLIMCIGMHASDRGLLAWPSTVALSGLDPIIKNNLPGAKQMLSDVIKDQKPWIDEVLLNRINQLFMNADLLLLKANQESKDIIKALIQDMQPLGSKLIDETAHHVTIVSHNFTVDLAQNTAKALLASTLGICGIWIVYHYLKAYLSVECHQNIKSKDVRWHERKLAHYNQHPSSKAAHFLLTKLKELQMVHADNAQQINMQAVQGGTTLFALACLLCCYWIR